MTIARDSSTGIVTKSGSGVETWVLREDAPERVQWSCSFDDISHGIKIASRMSADGRSRIELGVDGANAVIRLYKFAVLVSTLATAVHSVPSSTPGRIFVEKLGDSYRLRVGVSDASDVEIMAETTELRAFSPRVGLVFPTAGGVVRWFEQNTLKDKIRTLSRLGVCVIGSDLYRSEAPGRWELVKPGVFPGTGPLHAAGIGGLRIVGDGVSIDYEPVTNAVTNSAPTAGTMPGQTTPGTTTATLTTQFQGGLVYAGMPEANLSIVGTAVNEPDDLDTGAEFFGKAYELGAGSNATVGDPIVAICPGPGDTLFAGCTRSLNWIVGDIYAGAYEIDTRSTTIGPGGPDAVFRVSAGGSDGSVDAVAIAAPEGLFTARPGLGPADVSGGVLRRHLTFAADSGVSPILLRDASRRWLMVFLDRGTAEGSRHLIYHEPTGGYSPGSPAWFPISLPFRVTAVGIVRGVPLIGTSDGRIGRFSDGVVTDFGEPIRTVITTALIDIPPRHNDVLISRPSVELGVGSVDVTIDLYGAETAQKVYDATSRELLDTGTASVGDAPVRMRGRAPFVAMVLSASAGRVSIEKVEADIGTAGRSMFGASVAPSTLPSPCRPPVAVEAPTPPDDGPLPPEPGASPSGAFTPDFEEFSLWEFPAPFEMGPTWEEGYSNIPTPPGDGGFSETSGESIRDAITDIDYN